MRILINYCPLINEFKMRRTLVFNLAFFVLLTSFCLGQTALDSVFVSNVRFNNAEFNNPHAGSGFVLSYQNQLYGITAKHVLFFAKTDSMSTISFNGALDSWNFTSPKKPEFELPLGDLVNEDPKEKLSMPPKGDWLIFKITQRIPKNVAVYELRERSIKPGEALYFMGYPYNSEVPVRVKGVFAGSNNDGSFHMDVAAGTYNGCSGGPVTDSAGKLVGIVSMGYFDQKANKMIFKPASLEYFKSVMGK